MDMMAWNDLDIDIENQDMSQEKLYELTAFIIERFHPVWYEGKEEINEKGKKVWFLGFETTITGELWNVDLWFFDRDTIRDAEAYCDNKSMDVYRAVMEHNVKNIEKLLAGEIK